MLQQSFQVHGRDQRVLVSDTLDDMTRVDGEAFKAGLFGSVLSPSGREELLAVPSELCQRVIPVFLASETAPPSLRAPFSADTLEVLARINQRFVDLSPPDTEAGILITRNFASFKPFSLGLHYEGHNGRGPSMLRDMRGNLSVGAEGEGQMVWVPTDTMSDADIRKLLEARPALSPTAPLPEYLEQVQDNQLAFFYGLDGNHPSLTKDGLLHAGPCPHDRVSIVWGIKYKHDFTI